MAEEKYQVLARKWRPKAFDEVVGQQHITRTLQNALTSGRIGHAFLFIGSRGIGKTTTARILAKALNCLAYDKPTPTPCCECDNCRTIAAGTNIDVIEIDGASNNSVDHVREVREQIRLVPSRSRYKIYIIDEVHQLSVAAFNALLKTLEEPPPHAIFVLATTEAHKIPATIISRCQRYDFRRVPMSQITELLQRILEKEQMTCSGEALYAIARAAEGGIRDAESILDQLMSYCDTEITFQDVFDVLGLVDWRVMHELCDALLENDVARQLKLVEDVVVAGKDLNQFVQDILQYFRNLLVCKTADARSMLALPDEEVLEMQSRADRFSLTTIIRMVEQFAELSKGFDSQLAQRIALEALLIRLSKVAVEVSVDSVLEKLILLGQQGVAGPATSSPSVDPVPPPPESKDAASGTPAPAPDAPLGPEPEPQQARREVSRDTLREDWLWLREFVYRQDVELSLKTWVGSAVAAGLDDDAIILEFANRDARDHVNRPENRQLLAQVLQDHTTNLIKVHCQLVAPEEEAVETDSAGQQPTLFAGAVSAEDGRKALEDPHIARVVDVFKGRIVDIRHHVKES